MGDLTTGRLRTCSKRVRQSRAHRCNKPAPGDMQAHLPGPTDWPIRSEVLHVHKAAIALEALPLGATATRRQHRLAGVGLQAGKAGVGLGLAPQAGCAACA